MSIICNQISVPLFLRSFWMFHDSVMTPPTLPQGVWKRRLIRANIWEWNKNEGNIDSVSVHAGYTLQCGHTKESQVHCVANLFHQKIYFIADDDHYIQHDYHKRMALYSTAIPIFICAMNGQALTNRRKNPMACTDAIESSTSTADTKLFEVVAYKTNGM